MAETNPVKKFWQDYRIEEKLNTLARVVCYACVCVCGIVSIDQVFVASTEVRGSNLSIEGVRVERSLTISHPKSFLSSLCFVLA